MNSAPHQNLKNFCLLIAAMAAILAAVPSAQCQLYQGLKPDQFMKKWLILKSIPVRPDSEKPASEQDQKDAFARDTLAAAGGEAGVKPAPAASVTIDKKVYTWRALESKDNVVDLREGSDPTELAIAYAWAEIKVKKQTKALLGIGSDDGVKLWLNGKLVHQNWISRPAQADDDMVPVVFEPGKNFLLLKIQNTIGPWGFACRVMGDDSQAGKFFTALWNAGDAESLQHLIDSGLDVNSRTGAGLTPWLCARLRGQNELADFLASKGAHTNLAFPSAPKLVDSLFEHVIHPGDPGASVLLARDGVVLFEKGYGLADVAHQRPVNADTKFRIGSITKQFTAVAILKLQEQGKLSVNDKLSKYFPGYLRGDEVTLRHLLTHTSGIHNYTSKPGFMDSVTNPISPEALVASFSSDPFDFDPGKRWSYCNSGFFLLGCIIEKVSGQSYENFLRESFFKPLGMKSTGVHHSDAALQNVALGYDGSAKRAVNWDMTRAGGAGALYSTVGDLYRWNEAVFHGKVLTAASLDAAFKPVKTSEDRTDGDTGYGFGWAIAKFRGTAEISHGGGLNGFTSYLLRLPDKNLTVAVMANGGPDAAPQNLAHQIAELYLGMELQPRPRALQVPVGNLDPLIGRYDYGDAVLMVEREGSRLFARLGLQPRFEIFPKSENEFFWKVVDAQVTFAKGPDGKIVEAVHHQNGATIHAPRLPELKVVELDPSGYDVLAGQYKIEGTELVATITRDGSHLFGQMPSQPKIELFPKSQTEFGVREVNAQVIFIKDGTGKVTRARLVQSGQTVEASKVN